jgi:hypothetical protein
LLLKFDGSSPYSKESAVGPLLIDKNPVYTLKSYLLKIHFGSIPRQASQFMLPDQELKLIFLYVFHLSPSCSMFSLFLLDLLANRIWRRVKIMKPLIAQIFFPSVVRVFGPGTLKRGRRKGKGG